MRTQLVPAYLSLLMRHNFSLKRVYFQLHSRQWKCCRPESVRCDNRFSEWFGIFYRMIHPQN